MLEYFKFSAVMLASVLKWKKEHSKRYRVRVALHKHEQNGLHAQFLFI